MSTTTMDTDDVLGRSRTHALHRSSFFERLVATDARLGPTIARLGLGVVMLPHALMKVTDFPATWGFFTGKLGLPGPIALLAIGAEIVGSVALVLGLLTRAAAVAIASVMVGALFLVHLPHGFFMNWFGTQQGEGIEYFLLAIALSLVCLFAGGGRFSIDRTLMGRHPAREGGMNPSFANVTEG